VSGRGGFIPHMRGSLRYGKWHVLIIYNMNFFVFSSVENFEWVNEFVCVCVCVVCVLISKIFGT